jgi:hypothetical protein
LLTVFNSILGGNGKRVIKYARSVHKPDAVLSKVEIRFLIIPFEKPFYSHNCITILYIQCDVLHFSPLPRAPYLVRAVCVAILKSSTHMASGAFCLSWKTAVTHLPSSTTAPNPLFTQGQFCVTTGYGFRLVDGMPMRKPRNALCEIRVKTCHIDKFP